MALQLRRTARLRLLLRGAALSPRRGCAGLSPASRLRVLLDMDGVIADFEGGFLKKYRQRYPNDPYISLEERRGFWVSTQYGELRGDLCDKAISIWESKNFFMELEPIPGSVEAVKEMAKMKNTDVFICTSPIKHYAHCPYEKYAWVERHLGPDFLEKVILTRDKTIVWSPIHPGNTFFSLPATTSTCLPAPPRGASSPGLMTGGASWRASASESLVYLLMSSPHHHWSTSSSVDQQK
ncbi:5'(3')-deoxyribonucleotidase, mitochondrial isoform X1 [Pangasianodon hypophthalmus]|uniref:5'(3')-deoxyribonucleotidase, mitochondrial isoform X1 n=1 Tax=Pangasianodon hypophthalmus TaxID=310915 RepID=UPI000EFEBBFD|nr:5'(3')-deoxyribonucleotidase, mitochondrial isoform X1 [Pangasianodon hypophthalmus]